MDHVVPLTKVNHPVPLFLCSSRKEYAVAKETGRTEDPVRVFLPLCFLCYVPLSLHPPAGRERESTQHYCWMYNPEKRLDDEDIGRLCPVNHIQP